MFTQSVIQAQIEENIKGPRHWPLWGEFTAQRANDAKSVSIWWRHHETQRKVPLLQIGRLFLVRLVIVLTYIGQFAVNTFRPRKNDRLFPDGIYKCIFLNENVWISIKISLKFVKGPINNIPSLVRKWLGIGQATSHCLNQWWCSLLTLLWVTRPQRVYYFQRTDPCFWKALCKIHAQGSYIVLHIFCTYIRQDYLTHPLLVK